MAASKLRGKNPTHVIHDALNNHPPYKAPKDLWVILKQAERFNDIVMYVAWCQFTNGESSYLIVHPDEESAERFEKAVDRKVKDLRKRYKFSRNRKGSVSCP